MSGENEALLQTGASAHIIVAATHPVFTPEANENLNHPAIREIVVTDSIPVSNWPRVETVSLAPMLAEAIRRSTAGESMANLFQEVIHGSG